MPFVSDSVINLFRDLNASMVTMSEAVRSLPGVLRRILARLDEMARTDAEVLEKIRATEGFVASLIASQDALREKVQELLDDHDVSDEVGEEVDKLFEQAKAGAAPTAAAIVENNTPADPIPNPQDPQP